jgi:hypothetical protein
VALSEDERFEQYLKKFQPLAPEPLPDVEMARGTRRSLVLGAWAAAAAMVVVAAVLLLHPLPKSGYPPHGAESTTRVEPLANSQALTIGAANTLLAHAPSAKAAVDGVAAQAFQSHSISLSEGRQSALAVLSKEKTKL